MKKNLILKHQKIFQRNHVLILLSAIACFFITSTKSIAKENVFTINNIEITGIVDLNFSREKYINRAFKKSFKILINKILLTRDLDKLNNIDLKQIKNLISSFQILEENYSKDEYKVNIKILFDDIKVKKFLGKKNISFSQPESITAVFYPILFVNGEIQNFSDNYFYKKWDEVTIDNEVINFILPLEDLEDLSKIIEMKNRIEELNIDSFISKYDVENYVFALMDYQSEELNIHLKTNFNNHKINKNILHKVKNIDDNEILSSVLKDLKLKVTDIWKEENLINLLMPLSINVKFQHKNLKNLDNLRKILKKISIIDSYTLEEFNINDSFFKIYYYGDPKKLKSELSSFGYQLNDVQGYWQLYLNE